LEHVNKQFSQRHHYKKGIFLFDGNLFNTADTEADIGDVLRAC